MKPKLIESIEEYVVNCIDCGYGHSHIGTECGKHYMFGSNDDGECCTLTEERHIILPYRVDEIIKIQCKAKEIIQIIPGFYNTKLFVSQ